MDTFDSTADDGAADNTMVSTAPDPTEDPTLLAANAARRYPYYDSPTDPYQRGQYNLPGERHQGAGYPRNYYMRDQTGNQGNQGNPSPRYGPSRQSGPSLQSVQPAQGNQLTQQQFEAGNALRDQYNYDPDKIYELHASGVDLSQLLAKHVAAGVKTKAAPTPFYERPRVEVDPTTGARSLSEITPGGVQQRTPLMEPEGVPSYQPKAAAWKGKTELGGEWTQGRNRWGGPDEDGFVITKPDTFTPPPVAPPPKPGKINYETDANGQRRAYQLVESDKGVTKKPISMMDENGDPIYDTSGKVKAHNMSSDGYVQTSGPLNSKGEIDENRSVSQLSKAGNAMAGNFNTQEANLNSEIYRRTTAMRDAMKEGLLISSTDPAYQAKKDALNQKVKRIKASLPGLDSQKEELAAKRAEFESKISDAGGQSLLDQVRGRKLVGPNATNRGDQSPPPPLPMPEQNQYNQPSEDQSAQQSRRIPARKLTDEEMNSQPRLMMERINRVPAAPEQNQYNQPPEDQSGEPGSHLLPPIHEYTAEEWKLGIPAGGTRSNPDIRDQNQSPGTQPAPPPTGSLAPKSAGQKLEAETAHKYFSLAGGDDARASGNPAAIAAAKAKARDLARKDGWGF